MSDCCTPKGYRTIFSEKSARSEAKRYRSKGLDKLSRRIFGLVTADGVEGRTVLEVGGGIGALEIEILKAGASRATNVELTPTYEEAAAELLKEADVVGRVERRVGDFVESGAGVEAADFVVLNRVICCYADMPALAGAAAQHARVMLVLSFPNGRWWTRIGLRVVNLGFRVFGVQFQIFTHRPQAVVAEVERNGLRLQLNQPGLLWQVAAFSRVTWP
jgi:hypothetical protein